MPGVPPANRVEVFKALCASRALRYYEGIIAAEHDGDPWIGYAVDPLQQWAVDNGLVAQIGQDAVQAIMAIYFEGPA